MTRDTGLRYLQINLYQGKLNWQMAVWIKQPGGRVPTTVRRFPDMRLTCSADTPLEDVLDELGGMVLAALDRTPHRPR